MVAILPYTKMPDTDEITFQKGDIFFVHNDLGDGWLWVTAHRTGEQGLVFKDLLADLDENIDPNAVFPCFHSNNQIQRFRIEKKGVRYVMGGRTFECLDAVI